MNFLSRLWQYQTERFSLGGVLLSTTAVVASSAVVLLGRMPVLPTIIATLASLCFLFHVRVIDEHRDDAHDAQFHTERPVQRGLISLTELKYADAICIVLFLGGSLLGSITTPLWALLALCYTIVTRYEFFMYEVIRRRYFLYNGINLVQVVFLQLFVYSFFLPTFYNDPVIFIHLALVFTGSMLFEVLRKIRVAEEETKGHDTYSWHLGLPGATYVLIGISLIMYALEVTILPEKNYLLATLSTFAILLVITAMYHKQYQAKKSEVWLMFISFLYVIILHGIIILALT